jgi:3-dehydroquinate synthase
MKMKADEELKNEVRRVGVRVGVRKSYEIEIGRGTLEALGETVRRTLPARARHVAVVSNERVFRLYGARVVRSLRGADFRAAHFLMGDGERYKSLRTAERALAFLAGQKMERTDTVVALGGGVVGDLAGFTAAMYLRGIPYVQAPTTLLAQIDSSVGGKTAVNTRAGKNLIGAFHQPCAVVIDTNVLHTLPPREMTAGWCEAIKQGAVGDRKLFEKTRRFLEREVVAPGSSRMRGDEKREEELAELIAAQCTFKARIVAGDELEDASRTDASSRRILNFGHTIAHALEAVTRYRRFRHGEAVGYGVVAAAEISNRLGLLDGSELELLRGTIRLSGRLPRADKLDEATILDTLHADKKVIGGHVQWVLLEELGRARIVSGQDIPARVVRDSLRAALRF